MRTGTVIDLFGGIRGAVFAVLASISLAGVLVLGALYKLQGARLDSCTAKAGSYQAAQDANGRTIDGLRARLAKIASDQEADRRRGQQALKDLAAEKDQIAKSLAATKEELADVYARSPSARAWSVTGVDRDVLDRLPRTR